jgi:hypothetical protein
MWKETALGNHVRLIVNGEASELITITWGVVQNNTICPLTFAVVQETVAISIAQDCRGYLISRIEIKGIYYMDDEVCFADTEEDIRKISTAQSEFAEWVDIRFEIHSCAYWNQEFIRGKVEVVVLENFNLCDEAIPQLEGHEAYKYLVEHKAPSLTKVNQKFLPPHWIRIPSLLSKLLNHTTLLPQAIYEQLK